MAEIKNITTDEICDDPQIAHLKQMQMDKFKRHSFLSSIGDTCKFIAGPMFGIGIGAAISAGTVVGALPLTLLAAAVAFLVIGVSATYAATNVWTDGQFNNLEIGAKSTAHHLVQEIEAHHIGITENNGRADGKTWRQYTEMKKTVVQQPTQSL